MPNCEELNKKTLNLKDKLDDYLKIKTNNDALDDISKVEFMRFLKSGEKGLGPFGDINMLIKKKEKYLDDYQNNFTELIY